MRESNKLHARMGARGALCAIGAAAIIWAAGCSGGGSSGGPPPASLSATTSALPAGQVGTQYNASLAASGGTLPYQWSLSAGSLPAGLSLTSAGVIGGKPTRAANGAAITVQVRDSGSPAQTSSRNLSVSIAPVPLAIATPSLPSGQVGVAYTASLAATGGTLPYQWSVASGTLGAGLSLASGTGMISGTPTRESSGATVVLEVKDSSTPALAHSQTFNVDIAAQPLAISAGALPNGQIGKPYLASLSTSGGTPPLVWSVSTATPLPAGLQLNASTGTISGTPTALASGVGVGIKVSDSGSPMQSASAGRTLNVSPATITVAVSPKNASLTTAQRASLTATTNDVAGVIWRVGPSGGSLNPSRSLGGVAIALTAPVTPGVYTVTATSVTDPSQSSSIQIGVTDLPGVFTYHNDAARDGVNAQEYSLAPGTVGPSTFGKLFSCAVDGAVYAQPLWKANVTIAGVSHNIILVATAHDSLYAFDADASPCAPLWSVSLIDGAHGATAGETSVPSGTTNPLVGAGDGDITPETGVIGTPVIDASSGTLYVVSKSVLITSGSPIFYQRLHAIDISSGLEKASSPVAIQGTYPGTGDGSTTVTFSARQQNQRAGLALVGGVVYIAWAAHEDALPYYGWVIGYRYGASGFTQTAALNVTPNVLYGGIWMSGGAPAVDPNGNLYVLTGNGGFDATNAVAPNNDFGDSLLQLAVNAGSASPIGGLSVAHYFTPTDQQTDENSDQDFGSGGAAVLADVVAGSPPQTTHLVVGGGKDGSLYFLNRDALGGLGDGNAFEQISTGHGIFSTAAYWNNTVFLAPVHGQVTSYALDISHSPIEFILQSSGTSPSGGFGFPGSTPSLSANGATNGIVWALDNSQYCTNQSHGCGPAVLHAYDATDLSELWNSSLAAGAADAAGNAVKFCVPTVANGKVYVGTRGNNIGGGTTSTSVAGELDVYGLKPN